MCGRFTLYANLNRILTDFEAATRPEYNWQPRYNVAPSQQIAAVRQGADGERELVSLKWGLIPPWSKDGKSDYSTFTARAETVDVKPAFRSAFKQRRCLIVADGYYEWKVVGGTEKKPVKQPYRMHYADDRPFGMAGLWEKWERDGKAIESCTIIVTSANARLSEIHDRMPVVIQPADYGLWLDPEFESREKLVSLLQPSPDDTFESYAVSSAVGNVKNQGAELIERA